MLFDIERAQSISRDWALPSWTTTLDAAFRQCLGDETTARADAFRNLTLSEALIEVKMTHTFWVWRRLA